MALLFITFCGVVCVELYLLRRIREAESELDRLDRRIFNPCRKRPQSFGWITRVGNM